MSADEEMTFNASVEVMSDGRVRLRLTDPEGNDGFILLTVEQAFQIGHRLCEGAYTAALGIQKPSDDPADVRDQTRVAREKRKAGWFEELYCTIREIADDWHREALRRQSGKEPGQYDPNDVDLKTAVAKTGQLVVTTIKDWDY